MIWNIVKKDLRALWWLAPALALAAVGYGYGIYYRIGHSALNSVPLFLKFALIISAPYLVVLFAVARQTQIDSPVASRADWHTRPIRPWDVLAAKALVALLGVILPWALIDMGWGLYWGLTPLASLVGAAWHAMFIGILLLFIIALAACFRTLMPFLLSLFGVVVGILTLILGLTALIRRMDRTWLGTVEITPDAFDYGVTVLIVAGLLASLYLLFRYRRVAAARALLVAATLGVLTGQIVAGEAFGRSWTAAQAAPDPRASITVGGAPVWLQFPTGGGNLNLDLPSVTAPDFSAAVQHAVVSRRWADGSVAHTAFSNVRSSQFLLATARKGEIDARPIKLEIRYRLKLRERQPAVTVQTRGTTSLGSGVSCRVYSTETASTVQCMASRTFCVEYRPTPSSRTISCSDTNRPAAPFYEVSLNLPPGAVTQIAVMRPIGAVDGEIQTGWLTPEVKTPPPGMPLQFRLNF